MNRGGCTGSRSGNADSCVLGWFRRTSVRAKRRTPSNKLRGTFSIVKSNSQLHQQHWPVRSIKFYIRKKTTDFFEILRASFFFDDWVKIRLQNSKSLMGFKMPIAVLSLFDFFFFFEKNYGTRNYEKILWNTLTFKEFVQKLGNRFSPYRVLEKAIFVPNLYFSFFNRRWCLKKMFWASLRHENVDICYWKKKWYLE